MPLASRCMSLWSAAVSAVFVAVAFLAAATPAAAQDDTALRAVLAKFATVRNFNDTRDVVGELAATGDARAALSLNALSDGNLASRNADRQVFIVREQGGNATLLDPVTGAETGQAGSRDITKVRVNNGLRRSIREAVGALTLRAGDAAVRLRAAETLFTAPDPEAIPTLDEAIAAEADAAVKVRMQQARAAAVLLSRDLFT